MKCRHCSSPVSLRFVDLGSAPPSNAYLTETMLGEPEKWFPLRVHVCEACWLVQTEFSPADELFDSEYAYFSSYSTSWVTHAERYVAQMVERFSLGASSHVIEVAANDGYLLQHVKARGIPCLGIEPTASTAVAARGRGIEIVDEFFGVALAKRLVAEGKQADLMPANNVLAHVPDINDFVAGFAALLKPDGVATFEFPHLLRLVEQTQFDTIYHEHFSYLSLTATATILERHGLTVFDVEELSTHGGSLRVFAQRRDVSRRPATERVQQMLDLEAKAGVTTREYYASFQAKTDRVKDDFLSFLIEAKRQGKVVVGYGAAAKGNTLMNYAGVRPDLLRFVVDRNPAKQGKFMPGSRIPIVDEGELARTRPEYIVILPWNLKRELTKQLDYVNAWQGKLVTPVP
ncbi:MAG: methyltransferase family protein [Labilithrix sp.]|nr:methyltransferase family protein [Labilithrix sp.]